jgi:hypothetical protein
MRVTAVERKGTRVSLRPRLVFFTWTGGVISSKTRFRHSSALKAFQTYFAPPSLELKILGDRTDLNDGVIAAALLKTSNAEYKFGFYDKDRQADE